MKTIDRITELLKQKKSVVLFDCGGDAVRLAISVLQKQFFVKPTALCDKNSALWGKKIGGIPIFSLVDASTLYPDAYWVVTNFLDFYSGVAFLQENGIKSQQILNYVPLEKRYGCRYLESYFHMMNEYIDFCCEGFGKSNSVAVNYGADLAETLKRIKTSREDTIRELKNGTSCDICPYVKEGLFTPSFSIRLINYGGYGHCNFKCSYCNMQRLSPAEMARENIDFPEVFSALKQGGYLSEDVHVQLDRGEITVHPRRKEIFRALHGVTVSCLTNCAVYSEEIAAKLACGEAIVNTSLDAGTPEMFKKIKGVDAWDRVCNTLQRYASVAKDNKI